MLGIGNGLLVLILGSVLLGLGNAICKYLYMRDLSGKRGFTTSLRCNMEIHTTLLTLTGDLSSIVTPAPSATPSQRLSKPS